MKRQAYRFLTTQEESALGRGKDNCGGTIDHHFAARVTQQSSPVGATEKVPRAAPLASDYPTSMAARTPHDPQPDKSCTRARFWHLHFKTEVDVRILIRWLLRQDKTAAYAPQKSYGLVSTLRP
jgi:hypothetical protein